MVRERITSGWSIQVCGNIELPVAGAYRYVLTERITNGWSIQVSGNKENYQWVEHTGKW